jgi:hypothetical protein
MGRRVVSERDLKLAYQDSPVAPRRANGDVQLSTLCAALDVGGAVHKRAAVDDKPVSLVAYASFLLDGDATLVLGLRHRTRARRVAHIHLEREERWPEDRICLGHVPDVHLANT